MSNQDEASDLAIFSPTAMSNQDEAFQIPAEYSVQAGTNGAELGTAEISLQNPAGNANPRIPIFNLSTVRVRMDYLQRFLTESVNHNTLISKDQMDMVSTEIVSAIHQIFVNGAAILAYSQHPPTGESSNLVDQISTTSSTVNGAVIDQNRPIAVTPTEPKTRVTDPKVEVDDEELKDEMEGDDDCEIIELDTVELLAEHVHFCEICGKGFKRDANLRMHMRAHGNQFKTPEALAKPEKFAETASRRKTRFSCPFQGCNRNKGHKKFKALKSIICVRNHFKRSHCPKMFSCNRCNKKSFSVLADLRSHLKHCGEAKWRCSCGTTFSRKDKLFGHMALFEGHMPAVMDEDGKQKGVAPMMEEVEVEVEDENVAAKQGEMKRFCSDNGGDFEGLLDGFGSIEDYYLQDMLLGSSPGLSNAGLDGFCGL